MEVGNSLWYQINSKYLKEQSYTIREISKITEASSATITKVKTTAILLNMLSETKREVLRKVKAQFIPFG